MNDKSISKIKSSLKECFSSEDFLEDVSFLLEDMSEEDLLAKMSNMIEIYIEGERIFA